MKFSYISAKTVFGAFHAAGRSLPTNVGVVLNDSEKLRLSQFRQITSGLPENDVAHFKVEAPSNVAYIADQPIYEQYDWVYRNPNEVQCHIEISSTGFTAYMYHEYGVQGYKEKAFAHNWRYGSFSISGTLLTCTVTGLTESWSPHTGPSTSRSNPVTKTFRLAEMDFDVQLLPTSIAYWQEILATNTGTITSDDRMAVVDGILSEIALNSNNLENIGGVLDLAKTAYDLAKGDLSALADIKDFLEAGLTKKASKAWLAYRYQYCTTTMDLQAICDYINGQNSIMQELLDDGVSSTLRGGVTKDGTTFRCKFHLRKKVMQSRSMTARLLSSELTDIGLKMRSLGIALTPANFWDCVPLSFVIDWIFPVGDYLSQLESNWYMDRFEIASYVQSVKRRYTYDYYGVPVTISSYAREVTNPPRWEFYKPKGSSTKTSVKRVLDGVSLLI